MDARAISHTSLIAVLPNRPATGRTSSGCGLVAAECYTRGGVFLARPKSATVDRYIRYGRR
jgi:hypothetical protein